MRRLLALAAAAIMVAAFAGSTVASPPSYQVNHVVGNFDILNMDDGSVVGHVVVDYKEPTNKQWVPGTLDVTWVAGAPFPYPEPLSGVKVSHTILTWAGFGRSWEEDNNIVQTGAGGSMCDFGGYWNATCHDFQIIIKTFTDYPTLIAFGQGEWGAGPNEWYKVGPGDFHITYAGPTGS